MQVFSTPLAQLKEDPRNARNHNRRNLDRIKASLERFGQQTPIVIDADDVIRKGNGTFRAAGELGWLEITCVRTDLVGQDETAYAIADNKSSDDGEWDELMLFETLRSLQSEEDAALAIATGFDADQVDAIAERLAQEAARAESRPKTPADEIKPIKPVGLLRWGANQVAMTAEDLEALTAKAREFNDLNGTDEGFVTSLLEAASRKRKR